MVTRTVIFDYDEIIIIGDTKEDMELASICNGISYLYAQNKTHASIDFADYVIDDLREVLKNL